MRRQAGVLPGKLGKKITLRLNKSGKSINALPKDIALLTPPPPPAIPLVLKSNLTISDAWLVVTHETADNAGERADLFLRLLVELLDKITPPSRDITDWDGVVQKQSDWTLNTAYHNTVPANASTGTWPLSPPVSA